MNQLLVDLNAARDELWRLLELDAKTSEQYRRIGELQYGIVPALENKVRLERKIDNKG